MKVVVEFKKENVSQMNVKNVDHVKSRDDSENVYIYYFDRVGNFEHIKLEKRIIKSINLSDF